jgi:hypothetical protein
VSATPDNLSGSLIDGRYRVDRAVASGGFGTVYAAFHIGLSTPVAVKVLDLPEKLGHEQLAERVGAFLEEARTLKRLRHPNIVAALDVGLLPEDASGVRRPFIAMEWCGGPTLKKLLEERRGLPMSPAEAWRIFAPLLAAMEYAHGAGVAHRDLKPASVVLEAAPTGGGGALTPRVIDFGIAKILSPDDRAGSGETRTASRGSPFTPRYAAPEQLVGTRTGPWTDVHALALIFVEMTTGRPALGEDGDAAIAGIDPVRPTPKARGVDVGALEPILARALALRPADRHPDAGALRRAMEAVADAGWPAALHPPARDVPPASLRSARGADLTAPPSSHTLATQRTIGGGRARRLVAAVLVAAGTTAGVQRARDGWPFSRQHLRDLSTAEIDRRIDASGLGACTHTGEALHTHIAACERGLLTISDIRNLQRLSPDEIRSAMNGQALATAGQGRAAAFALDGDLALIVAAPPNRAQAVLDGVLGGAAVDYRASAEPPRPRARSKAANLALAAWTGDDLVASVQAAAGPLSMANEKGEGPTVSFVKGSQYASVYLNTNTTSARAQLAALQRGGAGFAYALDGGKLLFVVGSPAFNTVEFVRRILAGAHADEVGVGPQRKAP